MYEIKLPGVYIGVYGSTFSLSLLTADGYTQALSISKENARLLRDALNLMLTDD